MIAVKDLKLVAWLDVVGIRHTNLVKRDNLTWFEYKPEAKVFEAITEWRFNPSVQTKLVQMCFEAWDAKYKMARDFLKTELL